MKVLKCLIDVPYKYTKEQYKAGFEYAFEEKRANEVLSVIVLY